MKYITPLFLLCVLLSSAQKNIEKTFVLNKGVSAVVFDLEHVFSIKLKSSKKPGITLKAISEGEYANHFVITEDVTDGIMTISGSIAFTFPNNQDKLSAHKVHAITIEITVPESLKITVNSGIGNLDAKGYYKQLTTNFLSGNSWLHNVSGSLQIQTVSGNINLVAKEGRVIFETKTGVVAKEQLVNGPSVFKLKTIKGNINIKQSN